MSQESPMLAARGRGTFTPPQWVRIVHPITGRFMFEYEPRLHLVKLVDRGNEVLFDLKPYQDAQGETGGARGAGIGDTDHASSTLDGSAE